MRINRVVAAALCAVVLGMVGCAKEEPSLIAGAAEESFRAWMAKYDPVAERKENGIYLRFVERGTSTHTPTADKSWLQLNYTMCALSGLVGETRSSKEAKLLDTWVEITHFVDDLLPYYAQYRSNYSQICEGLRSAFQYLRPGDSVRIYIPTHLGYLTSTDERGINKNSGYLGESTAYLDRPCYFDLRVNEVIDDPKMWEQQIVQRYAWDRWGVASADSVINGVYMRLLHDDGLTIPITIDSTVRYYYATRFLGNHLIHSNVQAVIRKAKYFYYQSPASNWVVEPIGFTPSDFTPSNTTSTESDTTYRKILAKVLLKAKAGQTIEWITTSAQLPNGSIGNLSAIPQMLPYEPRRMQMRLLRWDEKEDQSKYDWSLLY